MGKRCTIFVGGLSVHTRAKDVALEFEKFGPLIRCDIPTPGGRSRGYAFVEFENESDASEAYDKLKNSKIDGREVACEWARRSPARGWSGDRKEDSGSRRDRRRRSSSPRRSSRRRRYSRSRSRSRERGSHRRSRSTSRDRKRRRSEERDKESSKKEEEKTSASPTKERDSPQEKSPKNSQSPQRSPDPTSD